MDAKTLSEIVKNWVSSAAVIFGLIFTIIKGPSYVEEKKKELHLQNQIQVTNLVKERIEIIDNLEKSIGTKEEVILKEKNKDFYRKDLEAFGRIERAIYKDKEKQHKALNEIKVLLQENLP